MSISNGLRLVKPGEKPPPPAVPPVGSYRQRRAAEHVQLSIKRLIQQADADAAAGQSSVPGVLLHNFCKVSGIHMEILRLFIEDPES